jgi:hypothetical protein
MSKQNRAITGEALGRLLFALASAPAPITEAHARGM